MAGRQELLVTRRENKILSLQAEEGKIVQIQAETEGEQILGNIYVGKVRNIVKNIHAAFVEFDEGRMGYLSLDEVIRPVPADGFAHPDGKVRIGDELLVQVCTEAVKTKPPALTGALELPGRYVVLAVDPAVRISKKIKDRVKRENLAAVLKEYACPEYGFIARTNSADCPEEILHHEIRTLIRQYQELMRYGKHKTVFTCLRKAPAGYLAEIRDGSRNVERILTDDETLYEQMERYLSDYAPEILEKLSFWAPLNGKMDAVYNISRTIEQALMQRVWLKSGAYLVIQPTEALISIDINTGKAISKKQDIQNTYRRVNLEAAREIARQLRLRNLSGIIIIDFIDLESQEDKEELLRVLREAVAEDKVQTVVIDMTKLGLVELTRKKVRRPLYEQLALHS